MNDYNVEDVSQLLRCVFCKIIYLIVTFNALLVFRLRLRAELLPSWSFLYKISDTRATKKIQPSAGPTRIFLISVSPF